jgi:preprotein translocase subunit YajC
MLTLAFILADAQQGTSDAPAWTNMVPMYIMLGALLLFLWTSSRSEKKRKLELLNSLKKKDKVVTIAGIVAVVDSIKDDEVTLKIDENSPVRLRILRSAIDRVIRAEDEKKEEDKEEKAAKE